MALNATLGIVFPGQGSQSVGMLKDIADKFPQVLETYSEASAVLGYDLWDMVSKGPAEELDKTVHTQPALLAGSIAIWRILESHKKLTPNKLAGHSLGEYSALVCAKAIEFSDAVKLVAARGQFMQEAVPSGEGALAAIIGLDESIVDSICLKAAQDNEVLAPANFNSPGQIVISGSAAAVDRALILAKEAGSKLAKRLSVSVPSHCILMKPAADRLAQLLEKTTIKTPSYDVLNNVDVEIYKSPESIRAGLVRQLYMPVRWIDTIEKFAAAGITNIIECGPGKILSGLNKRIISELQLSNTADLTNLQNLLETVIES
jgi:[acyl-carrier-protein] S-malonyltransferase